MTSYFLLRIRAKISSRFLKAPFRQAYNLFALADHLSASDSQLIREEPLIKFSSKFEGENERPSYLYISICIYSLHPRELQFLLKMASIVNRFFIISNCSQHQHHSIPEIGLIWTRQNRGRDLGAVRDFLRKNFHLIQNTNLCIINSSCFWSEKRLTKLMHEIAWVDVDGVLFGTESTQGVNHFQTFLIMVPRQHLKNFASCTEKMRNWRSKRAAVTFGEYKIAKTLNSRGIATTAIYSKDFINLDPKAVKGNVNPSLTNAGVLLGLGSPFIKKATFSKLLRSEYSSHCSEFL